MMKLKIERVKFPADRRVIVISDIHGNLPLFKRLLQMADYEPGKDTLVLNGDHVQRGRHGIDTIRYIMELSKHGNVHALMGNNDWFCLELATESGEMIFMERARLPKTNLIGEMCVEAGVDIFGEIDMAAARKAIWSNFGQELRWLGGLAHILETPHMYFAHAGLDTEALEENDAWRTVKNDGFFDTAPAFSKPLVIGHWPTVLSRKGIPCLDPLIDAERRVMAIDGGNMVKAAGQLNALILKTPDSRTVDFIRADDLPEVISPCDQEASADPLNLVWSDNLVEIIARNDEYTFCKHLSSGRGITVPNSFIYEDGLGVHSRDATDYFLPVQKGETVKVISTHPGRFLAKKDGMIGWIKGESATLQEDKA